MHQYRLMIFATDLHSMCVTEYGIRLIGGILAEFEHPALIKHFNLTTSKIPAHIRYNTMYILLPLEAFALHALEAVHELTGLQMSRSRLYPDPRHLLNQLS